MIYHLSTPEQQLARILAKLRYDAKHDNIKHWNKYTEGDNRWTEQPHLVGATAEVAFSAVTNWPLSTAIHGHGDEEDFEGVELKAATFDGPDILLKIPLREFEQKTKPRLYVLARVTLPDEVEFVGAITRKAFAAKHTYRNFGYGPMMVVGPEDLDPFERRIKLN